MSAKVAEYLSDSPERTKDLGASIIRCYLILMPDDSFATRLKRLRQQYNISQVRLARILNVSKLSVWKWEKGDVIPRQATIKALADLFGVSEVNLLIGRPAENPLPVTCLDDDTLRRANFEEIVTQFKSRIATQFGTTADKIVITINL